MAAKPEQKETEMVKDEREDSGDRLADIFDAADEGVITSLEMSEMSLPQRPLPALEAEGVAPRVRRIGMRRGGGRGWARVGEE